jgi:D-alanyl-lipoteichoic acid acyltransferase DltB (MBOAT superfamily)
MLETQLHLVNGVVILLAAAIPIYLTIRLNNNLRKLTAILSIFILIHAVYCWLDFFGLDLLSDGVFEPLSAAVLVFFGISYLGITNQRKASIKNMGMIWNPGTFLVLMSNVTLILLLGAFSIFVWLAARSKDIRSFQFQISIFIVIWILGQVVGILQDSGIIVLPPTLDEIGLEIHVVSLVFLSIMMWVRFYYSERSGKRIVEDLDLT